MVFAVEPAMKVLISITVLEPFLVSLEQKCCQDMYCDGNMTRPLFSCSDIVTVKTSQVCISALEHWLYDTLLKSFIYFFLMVLFTLFFLLKCRFNYLNLSIEKKNLFVVYFFLRVSQASVEKEVLKGDR